MEPEALTYSTARYDRNHLLNRWDNVVHYEYHDPDSFSGHMARLRRGFEMIRTLGATVGLDTARTYSFGFTATVDQNDYDFWPDICWRCDAVEATTDVGLCDDCRTDLTGDEA